MAEQTTSSIDIAASAAQIMAVIADLASYPQWSDGISKVEVISVYEDDGLPADARFYLDSGPIKDVYELEYDWHGDSGVSWTLTKADLLTSMDGAYELVPADGGTTVHYRLSVDIKIPMIGMLKRKAERTIVDTALKGLKKRVEAGAPAAG